MSKEGFHYLRSYTVSHLDPFNRLKQPVKETAEELLSIPLTGERREKEMLIEHEERAWFDVLGTDIDVNPLPDFVTPQVRAHLKAHGLELRYIPALDLDIPSLQKKSPKQYLEGLARKYPNWKPLESLGETEKTDPTVSRNLSAEYWRWVREHRMDFPQLPGQWIALETIEKPSDGQKYDRTLLGDKLGFAEKDRFMTSWDMVTQKIETEKTKILKDLGLKGHTSVTLRLLEALEWNLLANREGWGKTATYEWTNTTVLLWGRNNMITGSIKNGDASCTVIVNSEKVQTNIGFRTAVILSDKN